ncbi:hypothetical protein CRM22_001599 [Opisthorchis felineus]|uniref:C2H2-type domain-containing protein n=1 Tax=Opisthorchis felineus TaxID=147828 RepID=A0A4S2M9W7_OPIFE|nr:hypothetical protein CRM22_001599 [Opisthorchis felineus]
MVMMLLLQTPNVDSFSLKEIMSELDVLFKQYVPLSRTLMTKSFGTTENHAVNLSSHVPQDELRPTSPTPGDHHKQTIDRTARNNNPAKLQHNIAPGTGHQCYVCGGKFRYPRELLIHQLSHSDDRGFPCVHCINTYKYSCNLQQHIRDKHPALLRSSTSESHLSEEQRNKCRECGKLFKSFGARRYHQATVHKGKGRQLCEECGIKFFKKSNLHRHITSVHRNQQQNTCVRCGKSYTRLFSLRKHIKSQHLDNEDEKCLAGLNNSSNN